jgi:serine/threonine protein kinase
MSTNTNTRYQLEEALGRGGQGHTFRAIDTQTGQAVAVKVIELRGSEGWKPFDLFERECNILRALDHPGIPRFLDTFAEESAGRYCLVMELVEGKPLRDLLADRQLLGEAQLWNLLHQALEILDYLHGRMPPVIHRDIKPANLVRRPDGKLALVDFGGVRVALRPEGGSTVVGTFGYMAPEQLHGEAKPATDIYGLGATLAALATGIEADKLPRKGLKVDLGQVMAPSALRDLLDRMLEPDPDQRLASVTAVRQAASDGKRATRPTAPAQPAAPAEDDEDDDVQPRDLERPLSLLVRIFGVAGYVALTVLDAVILPLIFVMLGAVWSGQARRQAQLEGKKRSAHRVLRSGRRAMRALTRGQSPYRLGDHPPRPPLPPGPPRPPLPPRRGRRRRGRRR